MAEYRSKSNVRSVAVRRVGFICSYLKCQHDCESAWLGILVYYTYYPKGKSIANIIRSRYGEAFVRKIRKFEKNDYKLRKSHLDLRFLLECKKNNLIPKFLQFKLANRHFHNSVVYKKCQIKLLEEEIRAKRKIINILEKDTKRIKETRNRCKEPFLV